MDENKNQDEVLNNENQIDNSLNNVSQTDENLYDEILDSSDKEKSSSSEYTSILEPDDADENSEIGSSDDSEIDTDIKKSNRPLKVLIPIIVVIAVIIVAALMIFMNKSKINPSLSNSGSASSSADVPEASFKIDGKKVDTDDLVFLKINGTEIGFDELRNCYYQFLYGYGQYYGISEDTFKNASGDDLKNMFDSFKDTLAEYIKGGYVHAVYAKENNIKLNEDDEKTVKERIQSVKDEQGDNYKNFLKENYMSEKYLNIAMRNNVLADKVEESLSIPEKDFYKTAQKELYQVKQIFIPFGSEEKISDEVLSSNSVKDYDKLSKPARAQVIDSNYDALSDDQQNKAKKASKKVADNLYKKIQSGTDFDSLMKDNTYDSLYESYPKGVLVGKDYDYDEAYLKAALSLKENEISKVVESSTGYHIIMRVPLDKKYINKNIEYFAQTYNNNAVNKVLYKIYETIEVEQTDTYKNFNFGDLT